MSNKIKLTATKEELILSLLRNYNRLIDKLYYEKGCSCKKLSTYSDLWKAIEEVEGLFAEDDKKASK